MIVTECMKLEPFKIAHDKRIDESKMSKKEKKQREKLAKILISDISRYREGSSYNPDAIEKIDWALDVSDAERQLSRKMPIQEQYRIQSSDYFSMRDEMDAKEEKTNNATQERDEARKQLYDMARSLLFNDPLKD